VVEYVEWVINQREASCQALTFDKMGRVIRHLFFHFASPLLRFCDSSFLLKDARELA